MKQEVIVFQPIREHIMWDDTPPALPHLVYKLLHPLHGMMSLQQRSYSHETFIAAPIIFLLLLLFHSFTSIILSTFSSVIIALCDTPTV